MFLKPLLPKKFRIPPSGTLVIKKKASKALKLKTNQTSYLTQFIFWKGGYEKFEYTPIFNSLIKKVNSFFDVGANIGYYSLIAAFENPNIKITAFEPATGPLFFLKQNIKINHFSNIQVESIALSHLDGQIEFHEIKNKKYKYLEHNLAGESNTGTKTTGRNYIVHKVETTTFDNYISNNNISGIDLIKLDTEGTEHLILSKANIVLNKFKPIVICETLFNTIENELEEIFKPLGYEFYNHTESGLEKVKSIKRSTDNGVRNCFFVHPSKHSLISEYVST